MRRHPDDAIELRTLSRRLSDGEVSDMWGIERPPKQADSLGRHVYWRAAVGSRR